MKPTALAFSHLPTDERDGTVVELNYFMKRCPIPAREIRTVAKFVRYDGERPTLEQMYVQLQFDQGLSRVGPVNRLRADNALTQHPCKTDPTTRTSILNLASRG